VAPRHHRWPVYPAGAESDDVAYAVEGDVEPETYHPLHDQVTPGPILVGQGQSTISTVTGVTDVGQLGQAPRQTVAIDT
jgi:hypothetical protein